MTPVVIAVPHAGRDYPPALMQASAGAQRRLIQLEDRFADHLIDSATPAGATAIVARRARAWIDLNRDPREIDPAMIHGPLPSDSVATGRMRNGLGLIPRRIGHGPEYWNRRFSAEEIAARINEDHRPYHDAIAAALEAARERFGIAILLDCHSMPPIKGKDSEPAPEIVIGDRFGRSAAPLFSDIIEGVTRGFALRTARNAPYSGAYCLDRHGRPHKRIHALQIEIDRSLYLDSAMDQPGPGLARCQLFVRTVFAALAREAQAAVPAIAAE